MHDLYVTSEGERADYPRFLRRLEHKLARICLVYEKITNQRKDYLHKMSYKLAQEYDAVCIEDLNMRAMSRQMRFCKSAADNSFGKFREMLNYKLYFRGKKLIIVSKYFASSQLCSSCGYKNAQVKDLSIRS